MKRNIRIPIQHMNNENYFLKMNCSQLLQTVFYLQRELEMLKRKCHIYDHDHGNHENGNHENHRKIMLSLQNKNTALSKIIMDKNKQLSTLMLKYDIPIQYPNTSLISISDLEIQSDSCSDCSSENEASN